MVALELALQLPHKVQGLVLVNGFSEFLLETPKEQERYAMRLKWLRWFGMRPLAWWLGRELFPGPDLAQVRHTFRGRFVRNKEDLQGAAGGAARLVGAGSSRHPLAAGGHHLHQSRPSAPGAAGGAVRLPAQCHHPHPGWSRLAGGRSCRVQSSVAADPLNPLREQTAEVDKKPNPGVRLFFCGAAQGLEQTGQSGRLGSFSSRKLPPRPSIISRRPL